MKTINFNDQELESMIMMYSDELLEAKLYVEKLQEILKKLTGKKAKTVVVEKLPKKAKKKARKVKVKAEVKKPVEKAVEKAAAKTAAKAAVKPAAKPAAKPVAKPVAKKKAAPKAPATVESVVGALATAAAKNRLKKLQRIRPKKLQRKKQPPRLKFRKRWLQQRQLLKEIVLQNSSNQFAAAQKY